MGLPRPFKPTPKSPTSVMADSRNAPPVFNKHVDLHKGHKPDHPHPQSTPRSITPHRHTAKEQPLPQSRHQIASNKVSPFPNRGLTRVGSNRSNASNGSIPKHSNGTTSTELWIAQANAAATTAPKKTGKSLSQQSDHSKDDSYYEEEILTSDDDDGFFDDEDLVGQPQSERSMGDMSGAELDLFPEHTPTIRFDEYDEMQTVLHINDYKKYEINKSWYKREDYDKMVQLARKTAEKAEQRRKELEEIARQEKREKMGLHEPGKRLKGGTRNGLHPEEDPEASRRSESASQRSHRSGGQPRRNKTNREQDENAGDEQNRRGDDGADEEENKNGNGKGDTKKPIEYRGLEAWTPSGAAKVKILKESAIEMVWNEQSRQWDAGLFDPDAIRRVYVAVSQTAAAAAHDRGKSDAAIVQRLKELEALEQEKKRRRRLLGKSKALVKKSVKLTGKGVKQTGKFMQKTTKKTTKAAKEVTKRSVKAGVATATLDSRMMKEALKVSMKKRECKHETIIRASNAHLQEEAEKHNTGRDVPAQPLEIKPNGSFEEDSHKNSVEDSYEGAEESSFEGDSEHPTSPGKKKKSKLKLLGMVPIPGTKKVYKEDRREKKAEKRIQKQSRRPAWEAGVSTGKY